MLELLNDPDLNPKTGQKNLQDLVIALNYKVFFVLRNEANLQKAFTVVTEKL